MNELFEVARIISKQKLTGPNKPSEEQLLFLEEWINRSEKNKMLYNQLLNTSVEKILERERLELNKEEVWERLAAHTGQSRQTKSARIQWVKWAAALFIPLVFGILVFSLVNNKADEAISPGGSGALLTLSTGEKVDLAQLQEIGGLEGGVLSKEADKLVYTEDGQSQEVAFNSVETPKGKEYGLKLSDGTEVYLNPLSKVTFPVSFDKHERVVQLTGEAYFKVSHDAERPFLVEVDGMKVQVLGTSFSVRSYQGDDFAEAVLVEGKVKILDKEGKEQALLSPDHKAVLDKKDASFEVSEVDAKRATAWTEGYYYFEDAALEDIFKDLSRWYEFEITYDRPELKEQRFEGWINKYENLDPVLRIIEHTNKIKIEKHGKTLKVK